MVGTKKEFDHAGHLYYFLEDVYPRMSGRRVLKTPAVLQMLFNDDAEVIQPVRAQPPTAQPVNPPAQEEHRAAENQFPAPGVVPAPPGFNQGIRVRFPHDLTFNCMLW